MWSRRVSGPFPGHRGGVVAGGWSLTADAACAAPQRGAGEGPGSRVRGEDGDTQRWLHAAGESPAAGRRHLQVRKALTLATELRMEPEISFLSTLTVVLGVSCSEVHLWRRKQLSLSLLVCFQELVALTPAHGDRDIVS